MSSLVAAQGPVPPGSAKAAAAGNNRSSPALVKSQPAFAKRHPEVEVGSLDSFSTEPGRLGFRAFKSCVGFSLSGQYGRRYFASF